MLTLKLVGVLMLVAILARVGLMVVAICRGWYAGEGEDDWPTSGWTGGGGD